MNSYACSNSFSIPAFFTHTQNRSIACCNSSTVGEEVKRIFVGIEYLCVITLILSYFLIKRKIRSRNIDFLRSASIITVLLPVIVGILCAFNWDAAFTLFHEIMFRNDYWIFDEATDPVIMILPDAFFLHCTVMIILLILIGSLLCMGFRSFFRHRFML